MKYFFTITLLVLLSLSCEEGTETVTKQPTEVEENAIETVIDLTSHLEYRYIDTNDTTISREIVTTEDSKDIYTIVLNDYSYDDEYYGTTTISGYMIMIYQEEITEESSDYSYYVISDLNHSGTPYSSVQSSMTLQYSEPNAIDAQIELRITGTATVDSNLLQLNIIRD